LTNPCKPGAGHSVPRHPISTLDVLIPNEKLTAAVVTRLGVACEERREIVSLPKLHDDERRAILHADIEYFDNVLGTELRRRLRLANEARRCHQLRPDRRLHDLECYAAPELRMPPFETQAMPPLAISRTTAYCPK